jgi:hypothetical protein
MISAALILFAQQTAVAPDPKPEDVKSPESIVKALYDVISGPEGQKRDWNRFRSIFSTKGTLSALVKNREGKKVLVTMTPEDYINRSGPFLEKNGFFERETKKKSTKNGNIVLVFSDYESRKKIDDKQPFEKGTNSIQLFTDGSRWFIHSVLWEQF